MGFSRQEYWRGFPFPSPVDHVLSELSTMTGPSWVALHIMTHSFIELDRASLLTKLVEVMGFQLRYFKSWKMMLWKCSTQYASKFGKLSSGHETGKCQFSFQSQRKAMLKNAQTTTQLHSSHTLVKQCPKFSKPGFSNTWTVNFQMFNLVLEKVEEPEIKLPTSTGSSKKQESSRKTSISALLTMPKPLTVWITINCGKF